MLHPLSHVRLLGGVVSAAAYWSFELTLTALGVPVTIELPPAAQVAGSVAALAEAL